MFKQVALLSCTLVCGLAAAQRPSDDAMPELHSVPCAFDNGWIMSDNVAGLSRLNLRQLTVTEALSRYESGQLRNISDAHDAWTVGASTHTHLRLDNLKRPTVLLGAISYSFTEGHKQNGSVFIEPEGKPFNIVAIDSTAGTKMLERYCIEGASVTQMGQWQMGLSLRVASANFAKVRDARHRNKLLDLEVAVGALRRFGRLTFGLSCDYRREVEGIRFGVYGQKDKIYKVLVDYGTLWGLPQEVGSSLGYANTSREQPFYEQRHGSSFEVCFEPSQGLSFMAEFRLRNRTGLFGQETIYSPIFMEHSAYDKGVRLRADVVRGGSHHILRAESGNHPMENFQRLFRVETDDAGGQRVNYYGKSQILDAQRHHLCFGYACRLGVDTLMPRWTIEASFLSHATKYKAMNASLYHRTVVRTNLYRISVQRLVNVGANSLNIEGGFVLSDGYGKPSEQGQMDGTGASSTKLVEMTDMLMHDFGYRTANKYTYRIGAEYKMRLRKALLGVRCQWQQTIAEPTEIGLGRSRQHIDVGLTITNCL